MHRIVLFVWTTLAACTVDPRGAPSAPLADAQSPPPVVLGLTAPTWLLAGRTYTFDVTGGPDRQNLSLLVSTVAGPPYACPAPIAPDCLSIGNPFRLLQTRLTTQRGLATYTVTIPPTAAFASAHFQVAGKVPGRSTYLSPVATTPVLDPADDLDSDGLTNAEEADLGSDPWTVDSDGDGLTDPEEVALGTDPASMDTDGDQLIDSDELFYGTDPTNPDMDGDGHDDMAELFVYGTDPRQIDTDGDGLRDRTETYSSKTDPLRFDTDGDGLNDGEEVNVHGTDPTTAHSDTDGLSDGEEVLNHQSDPLRDDSDDGGEHDGTEVAAGRDPNDAADDFGQLTFAPILITEVTEHPDIVNADFLELHNAGTTQVDISGYTIEHNVNHTVYTRAVTIPAGTILAAGGFYLVGVSQSPNTGFPAAFGVPASLYDYTIRFNGIEAIWLIDALGRTIDRYGDPERYNQTPDWVYRMGTTQRLPHIMRPSPIFDLNEWTITPGAATASPFAR